MAKAFKKMANYLGLVDDEDFESEAGQIDGTLAHVIERLISLCVLSKRFRITTNETPYADASFKTVYDFS